MNIYHFVQYVLAGVVLAHTSSLALSSNAFPPATVPVGMSSAVSRLVVITFTDRLRQPECLSFRSALQHGLFLTMLGINDYNRYANVSDHKQRKLHALNDYLKEYDLSRTTVLFGDASDVLYLADEKRILRGYRKLNLSSPKSKVFFSAEKNFWPYYLDGVARMPLAQEKLSQYKKFQNALYPFANSGLWIADSSIVRKFVEKWKDELDDFPDDQAAAHELLLKTDSDSLFTIDYNASLLMCCCCTSLSNSSLWDKRSIKRPYYDPKLNLVKDPTTGYYPAVLHFNGDKSNFENAATCHWDNRSKSLVKSKTYLQMKKYYYEKYPALKRCENLVDM
mmetsp:Transcript_35247/g.83583  ORF Transcript_35247/g.83583 Transcript_35247/m.83583 type:complete len:336 (-) Transcript_35247:396-1403(-)|eukprot:CAMPEP_0177589562 /NCGR_PEP_ID=MMETSP0419_2-20121207/6881_1 /TAXON_ID=582737 /ORGANISM="Tetraselmis sp., Strain GSL018" /LENGTH=335 /DNA_ID=CAMNT_0019079947 /DNA_START=143 /DNA_END=1150 /DNA_ORIENTATION=+